MRTTPPELTSSPGWGAYVHVPWCSVRCPYCAFAVDARVVRPERAYTAAVLAQWEAERRHFPGRPDTVFFGGGTPSQADPDELGAILAAIDPAPGAEVSAEVNPGRLDAGRLDQLKAIGVNRVSLGVQSFQPSVARRLGRTHSAREGREVYDRARAIGFRSVSVDLMFAVPGQTMADFGRDLDALAEAPPDHVSLYGLTIEEGTPFARAKDRLGLEPGADDTWRDMYDTAVDRLGELGIEQYEVSNFAGAGHRCRHNEHYWRARPWAGLGASAHGFRPDWTRTRADATVDAYLADPAPVVEEVAPVELAAELIGSTLRHVDGLDLAALHRMTGQTVDVPDVLLRQGTLCRVGNFLRIRKKDMPLLDYVASRLCEGLRAGAHTPTLPDAVPLPYNDPRPGHREATSR